jgi:type I restriction enzyme M protein
MQIANLSTTSDVLGRYYTNSLVGSLLVSAMKAARPKVVLDLGAGDGALTTAAAKIWNDANYFTVDIDKNARSANLSDLLGYSFIKHHIGDALSFSIEGGSWVMGAFEALTISSRLYRWYLT